MKSCKLSDQLESVLTVPMEISSRESKEELFRVVQVSTENLMVVAESLDL